MRKNAIILPLSAIILGAAGFLLRRYELNTIYHPSTGLFDKSTNVTTALILLSLAVFIYSLILCVWIGRRYTSSKVFSETFRQKTPIYLILVTILGLGWLVISAKYQMDQIGQAGSFQYIDGVFTLLSALSAIAIIMLARSAITGKSGGKLGWSLLPPLFTCFWLVLFYRQHSSTPSLLQYAFTYLAIAFSTLGFYYTAGYAYGKTAAGRSVGSYMMAVFFSAVIFADSDSFTPLYIRLLFAVFLVYHALNAGLLIKNLKKKI